MHATYFQYLLVNRQKVLYVGEQGAYLVLWKELSVSDWIEKQLFCCDLDVFSVQAPSLFRMKMRWHEREQVGDEKP